MWRPEGRENEGISIPWTSISLHAITSEPLRSIYLQLDFRLKWPGVYEPTQNGAQNGHNVMAGDGDGMEAVNDQLAGEDEDVDEGNVSDSSEDAVATEINIIPQDENDINQIYYAMTHCQTMNPDPNDSISEEDDEGDEDFMEEEGDESDDAGMRNLHLNDDDDQQFADD